MTRLPVDQIDTYLMAFADGELGDAESVAVLEYLMENPQAIQRVVDYRRHAEAARRAMIEGGPPVPQALREKVQALAAGMLKAPPDRAPGKRRVGVLRRQLVAAAAAVVLGVTVGVLIGRSTRGGAGGAVTPARIPVALASAVSRTHVDCSRYSDHLHPTEFPAELAALPEVLRTRLGRPAPAADLSSLGYRFAGAGACTVPGGPTVHLLYRASGPELVDTVSLFLQPDLGQLAMEENTVYAHPTADPAHPMMFWRAKGVVYYLVADDGETIEKALTSIAGSGIPRV